MAEEFTARPDEGATTTGSAGRAPSPGWGAHGTLPLDLSVRLAEGRVRLGELRELSTGALVPLDTPVGAPFRLLAEGRVIGSGEIVERRGRLALRVTRLGKDRA